MKNDKFAADIKEKLSHHECDVPDGMWEKIEVGLPTPVILRSRRYRYYAVAAVLAAVVGVTLFFNYLHTDMPATEELPVVLAEVPESTPVITPIVSMIAEPVIAKAEHPIVETIPTEVSHPVTQPKVEPIVAEPVKPKEMPLAAIENMPESLPEIEPLFDELAMNHIMSIASKEVMPRNYLSVKAQATRAATVPSPYATRSGDNEIVYRHNMPLSVTASFEKRFGRWGVGTGITYTYMSADYEISDNQRKGTQYLHYLGIPLYVSFQVARIKRFSFYASAGGEVDFNISGIQRESTESAAYPEIKEVSVRDEKPQFSVQAHIGAAFELLSHLDLYIEPTLGYYFPNKSTTHSIWHDRLWNVSLSLGLRTGF